MVQANSVQLIGRMLYIGVSKSYTPITKSLISSSSKNHKPALRKRCISRSLKNWIHGQVHMITVMSILQMKLQLCGIINYFKWLESLMQSGRKELIILPHI